MRAVSLETINGSLGMLLAYEEPFIHPSITRAAFVADKNRNKKLSYCCWDS